MTTSSCQSAQRIEAAPSSYSNGCFMQLTFLVVRLTHSKVNSPRLLNHSQYNQHSGVCLKINMFLMMWASHLQLRKSPERVPVNRTAWQRSHVLTVRGWEILRSISPCQIYLKVCKRFIWAFSSWVLFNYFVTLCNNKSLRSKYSDRSFTPESICEITVS